MFLCGPIHPLSTLNASVYVDHIDLITVVFSDIGLVVFRLEVSNRLKICSQASINPI